MEIHFTPIEDTKLSIKKEEIHFTPLAPSFAPDIQGVGRFSPKRILPTYAYKPKPEVGLHFTPLEDIKISAEDDPFTKMSKFGKFMDIIGRPGYAMKAALAQMVSEPVETRMSKPEIKKRFEAMWRGFTGKERHTANEIYESIGVKGIPLLGFATEIATDPLMYGGYKAITKGIGKGVGLGVRGVKKIPGVVKLGAKIAVKAEPVTSALKQAFVTKSGIGKLADLIDKHLLKREYLKGKELKYGVKVRNVIQNIAKKTGKSIDDVERNIVNLIELPKETVAISPNAKVLANTLKGHLSNILTKEMKAGVPITALSKNVRGIQYFPRITSAEARQYLKGARIGNAKVWNVKLANALKRKTGDWTLDEFNAFVKEQGLESLGGRSVEQFFMKQPAYAVAVRGIRSAKAVTSAQFLDDVGRIFGKVKNPGWYEQLPDTITKLNPSLKGKFFDPEVATEIARVTKSYFNPNEVKMFMRMFDSVQNLWKKWTLAPFPKYHLRNMVGNIWNNYLAGVDTKNYGKAQALQMYQKFKNSPTMSKGAIANLRAWHISPSQADDIIRQAEQTAVLGKGWYAADIETGVRGQMAQGFLGKPFGIKVKKIVTGRVGIERGMALGTTIENNARLAHFLDKLDKGDDALTAAKSVKKFLFDYGDLTAFEKQVIKRLLPFYTWTRKNIPLQLEQIWKQPQKYAPLVHLLRGRSPQDLLRLKYAYPAMYERLPVEFKRTADTVTYVPLEGLIPAGDLAKMVRPQEIFIELLTPYLRAPIEQLMNKSFYFESEIQRYPAETQELLRMDIPVRLKHALTTVLPQARFLNEMNKLIKKQTRKEELTPGEQAFSLSLSSIYKVNLKDLRNRALNRINKKMQDLSRGMQWAKTNKREKEEKRIRQTYQELKELMKKVKGY